MFDVAVLVEWLPCGGYDTHVTEKVLLCLSDCHDMQDAAIRTLHRIEHMMPTPISNCSIVMSDASNFEDSNAFSAIVSSLIIALYKGTQPQLDEVLHAVH